AARHRPRYSPAPPPLQFYAARGCLTAAGRSTARAPPGAERPLPWRRPPRLVPKARHLMPSARHLMPKARHPMPKARHLMPSATLGTFQSSGPVSNVAFGGGEAGRRRGGRSTEGRPVGEGEAGWRKESAKGRRPRGGGRPAEGRRPRGGGGRGAATRAPGSDALGDELGGSDAVADLTGVQGGEHL